MKRVSQSRTIENDLLIECGVNNPSPLLQQAMAENSNILLDWLWYADQVKNLAERRYCFERALYIDPKDLIALNGLTALNDHQASLARYGNNPKFNLAGRFQAWMRMPALPSRSNIS